MSIYKMVNPVQRYEWGSHRFIQELLGTRADIGSPVAELWMGAHPRSSSFIAALDRPLHLLIAENPEKWVGQASAIDNNPQLPFLFKILAARLPLSIQAHPNLDAARMGFNQENSLGIPIDYPKRLYKDPNHKPELLLALTEFHALCGFRDHSQILSHIMALIDYSQFSYLLDYVRDPSDPSLMNLFKYLISTDKHTASAIIDSYLSGLSKVAHDPSYIPLYSWSHRLAECYPGDIGILAPMLMNIVTLSPFQALYIPPGVLHSYLEGSGAEIMANSDNVLRCALTPKHIDSDELLKVALIQPSIPQIIKAICVNDCETSYSAPVKEFALTVIRLRSTDHHQFSPAGFPLILFCLDGSFTLMDKGSATQLYRGEAVFVQPEVNTIQFKGKGTILHASAASRCYTS